MFFLILIFFISLLLYLYISEILFWKKQGVTGPFPIPLLGNALQLLGKPVFQFDYNNRLKYGRVYVDYLFPGISFLNVTEPELVKQLLVKDFGNFSYRDDFPWPEYVKEGLFFQGSHYWKKLRSAITPIFTGSKLRILYPHILYVCRSYKNNLQIEVDQGRGNCVDFRRMMKYSSIDLIIKTIFSIELNSYKENSASIKSLDEFFKISTFRMLLIQFLPIWAQKLFGLHLLNENALKTFVTIGKETIKKRKQLPDKEFNDLLDMVMKCKNEEDKEYLNEQEVIAQLAGFFFAGSETLMTVLSKAFYYLAKHPHIQEHLYQELLTTFENDKEISQDALFDCEYLNAVLTETMRMNFGVIRLFRMATKSQMLGPYKIRAGQHLTVPVYNLHHDPDFYQDPLEFQPERFLNKSINEINSTYTYIPFGEGPRKCIAYRFAQIEMRVMMVTLLLNFRVKITPQTEPIKYDSFSLVQNFHEMILGFESRN